MLCFVPFDVFFVNLAWLKFLFFLFLTSFWTSKKKDAAVITTLEFLWYVHLILGFSFSSKGNPVQQKLVSSICSKIVRRLKTPTNAYLRRLTWAFNNQIREFGKTCHSVPLLRINSFALMQDMRGYARTKLPILLPSIISYDMKPQGKFLKSLCDNRVEISAFFNLLNSWVWISPKLKNIKTCHEFCDFNVTRSDIKSRRVTNFSDLMLHVLILFLMILSLVFLPSKLCHNFTKHHPSSPAHLKKEIVPTTKNLRLEGACVV